MCSGRSDSVRSLALCLGVVVSLVTCLFTVAAGAQVLSRFDGLDADRNGALSRGEFSQLPFAAGRPELFVDLDTNHDLAISSAEWTAGHPDDRGIPRGPRAPARQGAAGALAGPPTASTRHGPNVPRERTDGDPRTEPPPPLEQAQLSGSAGSKRGLSPTPPRQSAFPVPGSAPPK